MQAWEQGWKQSVSGIVTPGYPHWEEGLAISLGVPFSWESNFWSQSQKYSDWIDP